MNTPTLPNQYDFSHGSSNPYLVEARHRLIPPCLHCHQFRPILLDGSEYWNYFMNAQRIDVAFPTLTPAQRELLISGTHPECWDALMGPEPD